MQFSVLRARAGPVSGRGCREQRVRTAASPLQGLASAEPRSAVRRSARALDRSESHSVPRAPATSAFLQASAERAGSAAVGRPPSRGPLPAPAKPLVVAFDGTANAEDTLRWALDNMALQGEWVRRALGDGPADSSF